MAIGDNHNDVEMLEFAGHPVIMGNACEELRGRGWSVTLGNDRVRRSRGRSRSGWQLGREVEDVD